jgi:hypothetical protein
MNEEDVSPLGETLEDFLEGLGERNEVYGEAMKRVLVWQIEAVRREKSISKTAMAAAMGTSRTQLERVLNPKNIAVSLESLEKAAHSVGKKLKIELVDE